MCLSKIPHAGQTDKMPTTRYRVCCQVHRISASATATWGKLVTGREESTV